jgi:hypothetical protein
MRVARHTNIEERGPDVLFRGGSQRLFDDGSQAEEFIFPPAEGMIVGESWVSNIDCEAVAKVNFRMRVIRAEPATESVKFAYDCLKFLEIS